MCFRHVTLSLDVETGTGSKVDILAFAVDHPSPATIFLITGDRDYTYAVSTLKLRKYEVILVVPSSTSPYLESQASLVIDWGAAVLRTRTEAVNSAQAVRQPYPGLDANLVIKLLRELQEPPLDDSDATLYTSSSASQGTRRISPRELLEPSRHSKSTPGRGSASTGGEPAPGELPIPKTPSRSRRASVSVASTRSRSTTIVAQSPPAVEQDIPAKTPPPSSAMRSSASVSQILSAPQSGVYLFCRFLTRQSYPCMIMAHPRQLPLVYPSDLVNRQATCQSQETQVFALPRSSTAWHRPS